MKKTQLGRPTPASTSPQTQLSKYRALSTRLRVIAFTLIASFVFGPNLLHAQSSSVKINSTNFGGVTARSLGPALMSGRIASIDAAANDPNTMYIGAASGGVWRSSDGGITFRAIFDDYPQSIGAVRIDQTNPQRVWVGTGESWVRNSVGVGNGVYRSDNGGDTWQHLGLSDSEHIAAIRISPIDSDIAWVCALGHLWDDNSERGVFKTSDGGKHWEKVLYLNERTGCADIDVDPSNPNILFASLWEFRRSPDYFKSGGPGSALYRSLDGGKNWEKLSQGLPTGELGRIAVALAPSRPGTIYANVESEKTALFRSDDLGASWHEMNSSLLIQMRPFYFSELLIDPQDHQRVYKPSFGLATSTDGGKTFSSLFSGFGGSIHPDHHALWINPHNPKHMFLGTDGGVYETRDQTGHWRHIGNLPVAQFYHVSIDQQWPYNVYGGLQDNGSWSGPSRAPSGVRNRDWENIGFGDGFWAFPDPNDNNIVYSEFQGGQLRRVDRQLGEVKTIAPAQTADQEELRFNWNTPLHLSHAQPGRLYYGSQYLHVSDDRGESWRTISPDLTTDDPQRQRQKQSGGLSIDNSSAENNATIYTISESPLNGELIWVGSDDGLVHLTRNSGKNWQNLSKNFSDVAPGTWVSRVEASPHDEATAFITFDGHRSGDMQTYLYVTHDYGKSWTNIAPEPTEDSINQAYAWVIKQDLVNPELLFLGTEQGLYISLDGGEQWARFKENLPQVAVHDIVIHPDEHDLILATHGRGVYIIDDITPLRALSPGIMAQNVALLPARPAVMVSGGALQEFGSSDQFSASNPPEAAVITYWLKKRHLLGDLKINVYDQAGQLITSIQGGKRPGINRVEWPMRLKPPKLPAATALAPAFVGPRVAEGEYRIELVKGKETLQGTVQLVPDPRTPHQPEDRQIQQQLALRLYAMLGSLTYTSASMTDLAQQAREHASTLAKRDAKKLSHFADTIDAFNSTIVSTSKAGWISGDKQLRENISDVYGAVTSFDGRPTDTQLQQSDSYQEQLSAAETKAQELLMKELSAVNQILEKNQRPTLQRQSRQEWQSDSAGLRGTPAMNWSQINSLADQALFSLYAQ